MVVQFPDVLSRSFASVTCMTVCTATRVSVKSSAGDVLRMNILYMKEISLVRNFFNFVNHCVWIYKKNWIGNRIYLFVFTFCDYFKILKNKKIYKKKNHAEILRIKSLSKFHKKIFANYLLIEFIRTFAKSATQNKNTCINTAFHSFPLMHSLLYTRTQIVRNVHPAQRKRK